ncbi:rhomboid family intramembrane serine protease [Luteitalea sp. TBR-22]|uniref:rhomboid family intramembrane serine protease n=1 Tax=Luteitalea sp. TBR-22 TaxID=2802971 RepID=UPI001EF61145|nr:rhomboid family intramembrane serine protease [Luteitalea sp. TBR-22]
MFPLSDRPNPAGTPIVTYALIALNVLIFVLYTFPLSGQAPSPGDPRLAAYVQVLRESVPAGVSMREILGSISEYDLFTFEHGYKPAAPQISDLLAAMFLHGGFMHLFGNMLFLWIYGDNVEHRLGHFWYLVAYLATGVAATLFFAVLAPGSMVPMVGASGAISGVLGFYFWWFPKNVVRLLLLFFPFLVRVVEVPARIVLGLYLVMDNLLPMLLAGGDGGGGVAHGAHIGGFVAGLGWAWLLDRRAVDGTPREYRTEVRGLAVPGSAVSQALRAGDMPTAARAYFALPPREADAALAPAEAMALGTWLAESGHAQAAVTVFQRVVRREPTGETAAAAHVGAGMVLLRQLGQPAVAYQHFVDALEASPDPHTAAAARAGLQAVGAMQKFPARRFS